MSLRRKLFIGGALATAASIIAACVILYFEGDAQDEWLRQS